MFSARCALCRKCKGAAYQSIPVFCAGNIAARYLVIAQNPGAFNDSDKCRELLYLTNLVLAHFNDQNTGTIDEKDNALAKIYYDYDFGISYGRKRLNTIFGNEWLESGKYAYTNAVRCRTPYNAMPSDEMLDNCKHFTTHLVYGRDVIFFIGAVARNQFFETVPTQNYAVDPKLGLCVFIPHYSVWKVGNNYKELVQDAISGKLV